MSKIQWTEETWNPVVGCTPVSPGCLNCYAATMSKRLGAIGQPQYVGLTNGMTDTRGDTRQVFNGTVRCVEDALAKPLGRKKPTVYFVCSMGDLFHEAVPFEFIDRVFAVMALCPQHTFQVLTKRPERMAEYLNRDLAQPHFERPRAVRMRITDLFHANKVDHRVYQTVACSVDGSGYTWPLPNVWLGTSAEDQARLDERAPHLLRCPAAVRFLSCEPLLGDLSRSLSRLFDGGPVHRRGEDPINTRRMIDWVIVGGESGTHARRCRVDWIRSVVRECQAAGVPVFVKQLGAKPYINQDDSQWPHAWGSRVECIMGVPAPAYETYRCVSRKGGEPSEWPEDLRVREMPVGGCER